MTNALTALLLAHRSGGTTIDALSPDMVPADLASAYAIQHETVAALGPIGAWKVGPYPKEGEPMCSPLPAGAIHADGVELQRAALPGLGIEVEVAVKLSRTLGEEASVDDMRDAIGSAHLALELISSRFTDRQSMPQMATTADLQNSGGIVLGAPVSFETLADVGAQVMTLELDGVAGGSTQGGASTSDMLRALAWLARHAARAGTPLTSGTVVITGARVGPVAFAGQRAQASAPGLGQVSATFV